MNPDSGNFFYLYILIMLPRNQLLTDIFRAYYDARKNKRTTANALRFELNFETQLFKLYEDIVNRTYKVSKSICFHTLPTSGGPKSKPDCLMGLAKGIAKHILPAIGEVRTEYGLGQLLVRATSESVCSLHFLHQAVRNVI